MKQVRLSGSSHVIDKLDCNGLMMTSDGKDVTGSMCTDEPGFCYTSAQHSV